LLETLKTMNSKYKSIAEKIETLILQDPGNRGISNWAIDGNLLPAAESILTGKHIVITTGFFILSSNIIETDGPPGVIVLAKVLSESGYKVTIVTDNHAREIMQIGLDSINCKAELKCFSPDDKIETSDIINSETTHFIALERPGKADNGYHQNFRGKIISDFVANTDDIFLKARSLGIKTIGIGDGGNELGMGKVKHLVDKNIVPYRDFSCNIESDFTICAGVSNWAGYGLSALLSFIQHKNLLPNFDEYSKILNEIVKAGAVDGVTGLNLATVDGLDRSWEDSIYKSMLHILKDLL